ncbi:MAG TPA: ribonuclease III [Patescibacteria group bacterium]|nr:ribonuclease III [Patescibacteria group bacterium]
MVNNSEEIKILFKNKSLFEQALTHKSVLNENPEVHESNERLEFLGDAILEYVVTDYLYKKLPDKSEGYLTALRANIVNTVNLARFARKINIGEKIYFSKGEEESAKDKDSILADTIEAIIGAIYIDQGLKIANKFILDNILFDLDQKLEEPLKDAKSTLQEILQAQKKAIPKYKTIKITGPDHEKEFTVGVIVDGKEMGRGTGKNKNKAEQKAAQVALEALKV